jgi:nucleoside-diphosphate-sugar epimerase
MTSAASSQPLRLIIGCGYLGGRVARRWAESGSHVLATTRRQDRVEPLRQLGAHPVIVDVTDPAACWNAIFATHGVPATVFWAVGFDRTSGTTHRDVHVDGLRRLLDAVAAVSGAGAGPRMILSSSTGVWGDAEADVVDETTPPSPTRDAGAVLVEAERMLTAHPAGPGTTLRFAGLYGPARLPRIADLRAGRPIAADPETWLNLVHVDDAATAVCLVADALGPRPLYVVSDGHPIRRRDWYGSLAAASGSPEPRWDPAAPRPRGGDKRVDPGLIVRDLGFTAAYPNAIAALGGLV